MEPWWASKLGTGSSEWWLGALDGVKLSELPGKQRVGLFNALVDLLRHLVSYRLSHDPQTLALSMLITCVQSLEPIQLNPACHELGVAWQHSFAAE